MPGDVADRAEVAARRERVLALRAVGASFTAIARTLAAEGKAPANYDAAAAAKDVERALAHVEDLEAAGGRHRKALELYRLEMAERSVQAVLQAAQGASGENAQPSVVLAAVDRLLRISERRAALTGLDKDRPPSVTSPLDKARQATDEVAKQRQRRQGQA